MENNEYILRVALTALIKMMIKDGFYSVEELKELYTLPSEVLEATVKSFKEKVLEGATTGDFSEKIKVAAFQALTERGESGIGYVDSSNTVKA